MIPAETVPPVVNGLWALLGLIVTTGGAVAVARITSGRTRATEAATVTVPTPEGAARAHDLTSAPPAVVAALADMAATVSKLVTADMLRDEDMYDLSTVLQLLIGWDDDGRPDPPGAPVREARAALARIAARNAPRG